MIRHCCLLLAVCLGAADIDPLNQVLQLEDGDAFATDRMEQILNISPIGTRAALVERLAATTRDDVEIVLHRMIQDEDQAAATVAIDALAKRWPTTMQDAETVRLLIRSNGTVGDAACRYAAAIGDDEALPALIDRFLARPDDTAAEQALRSITGLPNGCGPGGWSEEITQRLERSAIALDKAEKLLEGTSMEAIAAVTLVAGMRPAGTRATQILIRATEHPDRTVRRSAMSILVTCATPPAAVWRKHQAARDERSDEAVANRDTGTSDHAAHPGTTVDSAAITTTASTAVADPPRSHAAWLLGLLAVGAAITGGLWYRRHSRPMAIQKPAKSHITWAR